MILERDLLHGRLEDRVIDLKIVLIGSTDISHRNIWGIDALSDIVQKVRTVLLLPEEKATVGEGIDRFRQRKLLGRLYEMRCENSIPDERGYLGVNRSIPVWGS